jgi:outer membrane protein assembly factor BamB
MRTQARKRSGNVWLLASALLFALVALLAVAVYVAEDQEHLVDPNEVAALTGTGSDAEGPPRFVDPARPATDPGWPQWRGLHRDGVAWTATPVNGLTEKVLWEAPAGRGFGSCVVVGDRFYALQRENDTEVVLCLDASTGNEIWRQAYATPWPKAPQYGHGPRSTPTVADGFVYTQGVTGLVQCRRADKGDLVWQKDLLAEYGADMPQWGVACSPLVEGDRVIVVPGGRKATVVALDRHTGNEVWASTGLKDAPGYSSPAVADFEGGRQVVVLTATTLVGLEEASGRLLWSFPWSNQVKVNAATPLLFQTVSRGRLDDYVFITSGYSRGCVQLHITRAGDAFTVQQVYKSTRLRSQISSPVRSGDHLFGFDESNLTCLNLRTGEQCWQKEGFDRGSLLLVGDRLVVLGENGTLALAEATSRGYEELARTRPFGNDQFRCWTMPVLAGGRLYLRGQPADDNDTPSGRWLCLDLTQGKK